MFDIVLASAPGTSFSGKLIAALRAARMRVVPCDVAPLRPPPSALRVDVAVACAPTGPVMLDVARSVRSAFDGPPPVVGVSGRPHVPAAAELAQSLPDDVPTPVLVSHVQRAAAQAERYRSRIVLRGELDGVGLGELLTSLASRMRTCFVRIREGSRRAEVTLESGRVIHMRADGIDASRDREAAMRAVDGWIGATFEVVADESTPPPRTRAGGSERPPVFAPSPATAGDAGDVALAAAVINACAAYGRAFLGDEKATALLTVAWERARAVRPDLDAFAVSRDGPVSVVQVDRARAAIPHAVAEWLTAFFDDAAQVDPIRFRRLRLREVLGGLSRLVEQVGWATAFLQDRPRSEESTVDV